MSEVNKSSENVSGESDGPEGSPSRIVTGASAPSSSSDTIVNPFEPYIFERLHLPTILSPTLFGKSSSATTGEEEKFESTIEGMSILHPADIDVTTMSRHVDTDDPQTEAVAQEKILEFFSKAVIAPSPASVEFENNRCLFEESPDRNPGESPVRGSEEETALNPYFYDDAALYKQLFEYEDDDQESEHSSLDAQSWMSSPNASLRKVGSFPFLLIGRGGSPPDLENCLENCQLSPIKKTSPCASRTRLSRSTSQLDFSENMSIGTSTIVPDLGKERASKKRCVEGDNARKSIKEIDVPSGTNSSWGMEYGQLTFAAPSTSGDSGMMDVSNDPAESQLFQSKGIKRKLYQCVQDEEPEDADKNNPAQ